MKISSVMSVLGIAGSAGRAGSSGMVPKNKGTGLISLRTHEFTLHYLPSTLKLWHAVLQMYATLKGRTSQGYGSLIFASLLY